jgi:hypothetical protein
MFFVETNQCAGGKGQYGKWESKKNKGPAKNNQAQPFLLLFCCLPFLSHTHAPLCFLSPAPCCPLLALLGLEQLVVSP